MAAWAPAVKRYVARLSAEERRELEAMFRTYHDAGTRCIVSFEREKAILQAILTDRAPFLKRIIARLTGFDGAHHRFAGKVTIERLKEEARVEQFDGHAIWELIYFGRSRPQDKALQRPPAAG